MCSSDLNRVTMSFELFVASRYLRAKRKQTFISVISLLSIAGVALGVAALIIVLGVMTGFGENLRDKILGMNPHIVVNDAHGFFSDYRRVQKKIEDVDGVRAVLPFLYTEIMLNSAGRVKGAALRGIDPHESADFLSLKKNMVAGSLAGLAGANTLVIDSELARHLGVGPGMQVHVLTPSGTSSAAGFRPKIIVSIC